MSRQQSCRYMYKLTSSKHHSLPKDTIQEARLCNFACMHRALHTLVFTLVPLESGWQISRNCSLALSTCAERVAVLTCVCLCAKEWQSYSLFLVLNLWIFFKTFKNANEHSFTAATLQQSLALFSDDKGF